MSKFNLAIIFGGKSSEHNVSRKSADAIINNISKEKYNLFIIGINKNGEWYLYDGDISKIADGSWEKNNNKKVFISPDPSIGGIIVLGDNNFNIIHIDAVIPVLHGRNGEDGTIQGLLELSGIPFVGCKTDASVACMDKVITSTMLINNNIKKPKFYWFLYKDFETNKENMLNQIESEIVSYPMFVKPANSGSSVGISKVYNRNELVDAIFVAKDEDEKILVEEAINGQEVECAILGNEAPIASTVGEIVTTADFYDYNSKYIDDTAKLYIPANISEETSEKVKATALKAYKLMGCRGLARIDFLIDKKNSEVFLNEINTFPGFTSISMYPKLMENIGIKFSDLLDKFIEFAIKK